MDYPNMDENQRRRLIRISDAIIGNNPLMLLHPPTVIGAEAMNRLHEQLRGLMTEPIAYTQQVYDLLRDNNLLHLINDARNEE